MKSPKSVLLVTNATTDAEISLIKSAISTQTDMQISLNLVHVIPSLPTCYFNIPSTIHLAEKYYAEAETSLAMIGKMLNVSEKRQWLITGRIKHEVLRLAHSLNIDFILASSTNIPELHKTSSFHRHDKNLTLIQSINNLVRL